MTLRAVCALDLSGRYATQGRDAAAGLAAWARHAGAQLVVEDSGDDPAATADALAHLAPGAHLCFGPYGSGPARAVAARVAGEPWVIWNHGGAALDEADRSAARVVDVLGPARRYWAGLPHLLAEAGVDLGRVALLHAPTGFGRATAAGAEAALLEVGSRALLVRPFTAAGAPAAAAAALSAGAACVVGCGRIEDDLALGRALIGRAVAVGLVVCGIARAGAELGPGIAGWFGPAQWWPGGPPPPVALPRGADYPAAQALAAALVAGRALRRAGSAEPDALWAAARALRTTTFLGPFAVDHLGRQVAHAPLLVRWVVAASGLERRPAWIPG